MVFTDYFRFEFIVRCAPPLAFVLFAYYYEYVAIATGQNYAKTPFTGIANMESNDTSMESGDKRSLSASASPTRDGILRSGPKHARAYKSPVTTPARSTEVPIEVVSELPAIESFPFNLSESSGQASLSHTASPVF